MTDVKVAAEVFLKGNNAVVELEKLGGVYKDGTWIIRSETRASLLDQVGSLYNRNKSLTKGHATLTRRVQELEQELAYYRQKYPRTMTFGDDGLTIKEGEHVRVHLGKIKEEPPFKVEDGQVFLKDALIGAPAPEYTLKTKVDDNGRRTVTVGKLTDHPLKAVQEEMRAEKEAEEQKQVVFQAAPKISLTDQEQQLLDNAMQSMRDSKLFADLRAEQQNRQSVEEQLQLAVADLAQRVNRIEDGAQFAFARGKGYTEFQRLLEQAITKGAEKALQQAVGELNQRLADLEFAASAGHHNLDGVTGSQVMAAERFNAAVRQQIEISLTPGGIIYNALKK